MPDWFQMEQMKQTKHLFIYKKLGQFYIDCILWGKTSQKNSKNPIFTHEAPILYIYPVWYVWTPTRHANLSLPKPRLPST